MKANEASAKPGGPSKAAQAAIARQQQAGNSSSVGSAMRATAASASNRIMGQSSIRSFFQNQPSQNRMASQGAMSEDEALARALQESLNEQQSSGARVTNSTNQNRIQAPRTREEQDLMLAQALAESQREASRNQQQQNSASAGSGDKSCTIC